MRFQPTSGCFPIKDYSCLKFAKKVMLRILMAADGFPALLKKNRNQERASAIDIRASAHTLLMASCQDIDTSAKGLKLSPRVMSLPVSRSAYIDVVIMSAQIPCDLAMSQDANQRSIVNGHSNLGQLILRYFHNLAHGGVKQTINRGIY